jgi:site-specific recombinase XerD
MKKMCLKAGITGRKTNHSIRKSTCTQLLHARVAPNLIQQITGNKNVQSISNYATASKAQVKGMNYILAGKG